mmetsp:Transcript_27322/g.58029  ORF Transcript_27322/g.58029 Transcript_27322/m.58029 type:complete len:229 (-) Transcript_27322:93-779(-)
MPIEGPREERVDEVEEKFPLGLVVAAEESGELCDDLVVRSCGHFRHLASFQGDGHRVVLGGMQEVHECSRRLLSTQTLHSGSNSEQEGAEELWEVLLHDQGDRGVTDGEEMSQSNGRRKNQLVGPLVCARVGVVECVREMVEESQEQSLFLCHDLQGPERGRSELRTDIQEFTDRHIEMVHRKDFHASQHLLPHRTVRDSLHLLEDGGDQGRGTILAQLLAPGVQNQV